MPRHLSRALDALRSSASNHDEALPRRWPRVLEDYMGLWSCWFQLGITVDADVIAQVRSTWSARPDLRPELSRLVRWYPCAPLERVFRRSAVSSTWADWAGWLEVFPDLRAALHPEIARKARQFNRGLEAIGWALVWLRHFSGSDEAVSAIANAINRDDRRQRRRHHPSDWVRHDLQDHGTITVDEARLINARLLELDAEPLDLAWIAVPGWWKGSPDHAWLPRARAEAFPRIVKAARSFAGKSWSALDVEVYAAAWSRIDPEHRRGLPLAADAEAMADVLDTADRLSRR